MEFNSNIFGNAIKIIIGIVALTTGGLIYIMYRSDSLLMFDWFREIGISNIIESIRVATRNHNLYDWVKNNMPAGLWLFSYLFIIDSIWGSEKNSIYRYFICILPIVALVSEIMQYFTVLPGTFDYKDLLSYIFAITLFLLIKKINV